MPFIVVRLQREKVNGSFLKQSLIGHDSFFLFFLTTLAFLKLSI